MYNLLGMFQRSPSHPKMKSALTPLAASPKNSRISSSETGTGRCLINSVHGFLDPRRPTGVCDPPLAVSATGEVGSGTGPSAVTEEGGGASPFDLFCSPLSLSAGAAAPLPFAPVLAAAAAALVASFLSLSFCFFFSFLLSSLSPEPFACDADAGSLGAGVVGLGGAAGGTGLSTRCSAGAGAEIAGGAGVGAFEGGPGVPTFDGGFVGSLAAPVVLLDGSCGIGVLAPPTAGTGAPVA